MTDALFTIGRVPAQPGAKKEYTYSYNPKIFHKVKIKRITYLVSEELNDCSIMKCETGRYRRFKLPSSVKIGDRIYEVNFVNFNSFNPHSVLRHLIVPDNYHLISHIGLSEKVKIHYTKTKQNRSNE